MPMYYFHMRDHDKLTDVDGTDLPDDEAARAHARAVVQELKSQSKGMLGREWSLWSMAVHDADDVELFSFPFTAVEAHDD